ncbi:unnamed protein product, partial [marine sediment metagenome]
GSKGGGACHILRESIFFTFTTVRHSRQDVTGTIPVKLDHNFRFLIYTVDRECLSFTYGYRDVEQIVDCDCINLTDGAPWLLMDLPLAEGQQVKIGIYPPVPRVKTYQITIGYTEAG